MATTGTRPRDHIQPFTGRIILDVPAKHPTFNFIDIAAALTSIIQRSEPRFAVGIFGGWGSGKSTLMEEIERRVSAQKDIVVVRFNAWRFEREPHLIVPLLDTVRACLSDWADRPEHEGQRAGVAEGAKRVGRVVRALVRATSIGVSVPGGPSLSMDAGKALDEMLPANKDDARDPQSLYYAAFHELNEAFTKVTAEGVSRIVVFVDDLDRCLPEQALTVLEAMKLFFDTPGFVFVVGLDERVVQSAVRSKFLRAGRAEVNDEERQLERDYLKKIFQVPYTLPMMVPGQLGDLLRWLEEHGHLEHDQRTDLLDRVSTYLNHVADDGRINPREAKRFINAYTISRMVRPDLDADTMLALQTMDFRPEWEIIYDNIVLTDPDTFSDVVRRYRSGERQAFEDLWPKEGPLPLELSRFLTSPEAAGLGRQDLARYVAFLEATRTTQGWVADAMKDVGLLRRHLRQVATELQTVLAQPEVPTPRTLPAAVEARDDIERLRSYPLGAAATSIGQAMDSLTELLNRAQSLLDEPAVGRVDALDRWRADADRIVDGVQTELRVTRRSSTFVS